ncbi:hypothetical protein [Mucilaginibacter sp. SP1R1]|nr:hypothetical protein [Mucilaginibacter sp. SP1R1]MBB6150099.1 hypothetical protein [Mucilaginibacter sp. SP1R1]
MLTPTRYKYLIIGEIVVSGYVAPVINNYQPAAIGLFDKIIKFEKQHL